MPDLKHFNYAHLPAHLQVASKPFYDFVHAVGAAIIPRPH